MENSREDAEESRRGGAEHLESDGSNSEADESDSGEVRQTRGERSAASADLAKSVKSTTSSGEKYVLCDPVQVETTPTDKSHDSAPFIVPAYTVVNCLDIAITLLQEYAQFEYFHNVLGSCKCSLRAICVLALGIRGSIVSENGDEPMHSERVAMGPVVRTVSAKKCRYVTEVPWHFTENGRDTPTQIAKAKTLSFLDYTKMLDKPLNRHKKLEGLRTNNPGSETATVPPVVAPEALTILEKSAVL